MSKRVLEETCWSVFESIGQAPAEEVDRRLKALDLLVKIRHAGQKVKPEEQKASAREQTAAVLKRING